MEHDLFGAPAEAVPELIRKSADERDGIFEVTAADFATILARTGVGTYDPNSGKLRVLGYPFANCLELWREQTEQQVGDRSDALRREEQPA